MAPRRPTSLDLGGEDLLQDVAHAGVFAYFGESTKTSTFARRPWRRWPARSGHRHHAVGEVADIQRRAGVETDFHFTRRTRLVSSTPAAPLDSSAPPTRSWRIDCICRLKSSGCTSKPRGFCRSSVRHDQGRRPERDFVEVVPLCTTSTRSAPGPLHDAHLDADEVGWNTPSAYSARWPVGQRTRMLKMVHAHFAAHRATCFIALWWLGANMKPMPVASMHPGDLFRRQVDVGTPSAPARRRCRSWTTPLRPPCLATRAPRRRRRRSRSWRC